MTKNKAEQRITEIINLADKAEQAIRRLKAYRDIADDNVRLRKLNDILFEGISEIVHELSLAKPRETTVLMVASLARKVLRDAEPFNKTEQGERVRVS